jgi:hypothetical protein
LALRLAGEDRDSPAVLPRHPWAACLTRRRRRQVGAGKAGAEPMPRIAADVRHAGGGARDLPRDAFAFSGFSARGRGCERGTAGVLAVSAP